MLCQAALIESFSLHVKHCKDTEEACMLMTAVLSGGECGLTGGEASASSCGEFFSTGTMMYSTTQMPR